VIGTGLVPPAQEIAVDYAAGETIPVSLHDGNPVVWTDMARKHGPACRESMAFLARNMHAGEREGH
jgi:hypothetical protein